MPYRARRRLNNWITKLCWFWRKAHSITFPHLSVSFWFSLMRTEKSVWKPVGGVHFSLTALPERCRTKWNTRTISLGLLFFFFFFLSFFFWRERREIIQISSICRRLSSQQLGVVAAGACPESLIGMDAVDSSSSGPDAQSKAARNRQQVRWYIYIPSQHIFWPACSVFSNL